MKAVRDAALEEVRFATAALKKLGEIAAQSEAETPATVAERERAAKLREEDATACERLVNTPLFQPGGPLMSAQYALAFRFTAEYLQKEGMMNKSAGPCDLGCIASLLCTCEPANFAAVDLLRSRHVEQMVRRYVEASDGTKEFNDKTPAQVQESLISVFAHLFGAVKLPQWHAQHLRDHPEKKGGSSVVLGELDSKVREILEVHSRHAIGAAVEYWRAFAACYAAELGEDNMLPFTGCAWPKDGSFELPALAGMSAPASVRSRFVSLSGHGDRGEDFKTVGELCGSLRRGLVIDPKFLPVYQVDDGPQNAYILDFWRDGLLGNLVRYNKIGDNSVWQMLKDFALVLTAMHKSLDRRCKYAPYKRGIHGEGRQLETVFSDPQVQEAFKLMSADFADKFNNIGKTADAGWANSK